MRSPAIALSSKIVFSVLSIFVFILTFNATAFGQQTPLGSDIPVSADYNGDGRMDIGFYRPSSGTWYLHLPRISAEGSIEYQTQVVNFGRAKDRPVPGDYDGDGCADVTVWRPSTGTWHHLSSKTGAYSLVPLGASGDNPASGDYDRDGRTDRAVYRPSTGVWYVLNSSSGFKVFKSGEDNVSAFVP